jgi:hypothetical protein
MITEQQFIEATRTVKEYFQQITKIETDKSKTLILDFINKMPPYCSTSRAYTTKLKSGLYQLSESYPEIKYVEDIKKHELLKCRGVGEKAWYVLANLILKHSNK